MNDFIQYISFATSNSSTEEAIIFWIFVGFLIFIIIREITTWYWKINKIVRVLENIENTLEDLRENFERTLPKKHTTKEKSATDN